MGTFHQNFLINVTFQKQMLNKTLLANFFQLEREKASLQPFHLINLLLKETESHYNQFLKIIAPCKKLHKNYGT